jgi:predicted permease
MALTAAVALLLAVACANVATLLLARGEQRAREMAVRAALGASRRRLARQMLAESALLGLLAAPLGLVLSFGIARLFARVAPAGFAPAAADPATLAFALVTSLGTAFLFGLWPARQAAHADLRGSMASRGGAVARTMVVAEVALLVVLLSATSLLARSSLGLLRVPLGFSPEGVVTLYVSPDGKAYPDAAAIGGYVDALTERLRALPEAREVTASSAIPTTGLPSTSFSLDGRPEGNASADVIGVGPGYFRLLRIPVVSGRVFGDGDRLGAPNVVVLSRAAAESFWPGVDPIGHRLTMLHWDEPLSADVVGVVEDVRQRGPDQDVEPAVYFSHRQFADRVLGWYFQVRTEGPAARLVPALRPAVASVDASQPADAIRTLPEVMSKATEAAAPQGRWFGPLAGLAFALVLAGIHGVLGRRVACRTREIGVRLALGARPRQVSRLVVGDGLRLALLGLALGLPASFAAGRALTSLLYRVGPIDLRATSAVVAAIAALALLGAWLPARRAARVDPLVCLRDE